MGVAVSRYIDFLIIIIITFPYSTCISSFFGSSIPTLFIKKKFSVLYVIFVYYIAKNIRDRSKNRDHANRINYIDN